jgi:alkanesulfonate monooxygenase SsuD/methylene tetrahydromethanopterin reductase-like flavin-dependent oxidoreductase (luciferase family)
MTLPLEPRLSIGVQTIHRRTEPAEGPWLPTIAEMEALVRLVDDSGYDSLWVGDHIAFAVSILDPLLQLAQAAAVSRRLMLGTNVYLLPLRHPVPVAKQVASLDHLSEGRLIFGSASAASSPVNTRPAACRSASVGRACRRRCHYCAGSGAARRSAIKAASTQRLAMSRCCRAGWLADGWISYVVTPEIYRAALEKIAAAAQQAGREIERFGTGHLLFARLDDSYERALDAASESLSRRYAMDFRRAAERYAALGRPEQIAQRIRDFHAAGARHIVLDLVGPYEERPAQIEAFARSVMPLVSDLRGD